MTFSSAVPAPGRIVITQNSSLTFSTRAHSCNTADGVSYRWLLNGEGVSFTESYTYYACHSVSKNTPDTLIVMASDTQGGQAQARWSIVVNPASLPPPPPEVEAAINKVRNGGHFGVQTPYMTATTLETEASYQSYTSAVQILGPYLQQNVCDLNATFAYALAKLVLFAAGAQDFVANRRNWTSQSVKDLYDNELAPLVEKGILLMTNIDANFIFPILNPLRVGLFNNIPGNGLGLTEVTLNFSGFHGPAEVSMAVALGEAAEGGLNTALAFNGMIEFASTFSPPVGADLSETLGYGENMVIRELEADPKFLSLAGDDGGDGKARLLLAQYALATALETFTKSIGLVMNEPSAEFYNHVFRFWDCGPDGICPSQCFGQFPDNNALACAVSGDPCEPYFDGSIWHISDCENQSPAYQSGNPFTDTNHNQSWNNSYQALKSQGTEPDAGEGNEVFDSDEPLGTEMVMERGLRGISLPTRPGMNQAMDLISKNILGPGPLDLDALAGYFVQGKPFTTGFVRTVLDTFGIPYPEIRVSEFFVTPTALRDMFPLYDRTTFTIIMQSEEEYCQEPRLTDFLDGCPNDIGVPGSNTSDWDPFSNPSSTKHNYQWDPGTPSEPFTDTGIWNGKNTVSGTAGNGKEDSLDIDHYWPTGQNVGGPPVAVSVDFRDTTPGDMRSNPPAECIEEFYLFPPDPTISGALRFPDPITNIDNKPLDDNAKIHRFVAKALQAIKSIGQFGMPAFPQ